jgi:hypothetical protein
MLKCLGLSSASMFHSDACEVAGEQFTTHLTSPRETLMPPTASIAPRGGRNAICGFGKYFRDGGRFQSTDSL